MNYSKYQEAIFNEYKNGNKNISISAGPGAGKTTTLLKLLTLVSNNKRVIFLAFNTGIVNELREKVPSNIEVSTLHALGLKYLKTFYNKVKVNTYKTYNIIKKLSEYWTDVPDKKMYKYSKNIEELVNKIRLKNIDPTIENVGLEAIEMDIAVDDTIVNRAIEVLKAATEVFINNSGEVEVDFIDMINIPVNNEEVLNPDYDEVFIDESQDLNMTQQKFIKKLIKPEGRFIAVGDKNQSIYKFMGADENAYERLKSSDNTIELLLPISYRCGENIIKKANELYNVIEIPEGQHKGEVIENGNLQNVKENDFVLCRNNKPLITVYYNFIKKGIPSYIKGKDIGRDILALIKKLKHVSSKGELRRELLKKLETTKDSLKKKGIENVDSHPQIVSLTEKIEIIDMIASKVENVEDIEKELENIFKDNGSGVILQTIHKSKGTEADNVYIYKPDLIPSKYAVTESELIQENNLLFVAITRAKNKLTFIHEEQ